MSHGEVVAGTILGLEPERDIEVGEKMGRKERANWLREQVLILHQKYVLNYDGCADNPEFLDQVADASRIARPLSEAQTREMQSDLIELVDVNKQPVRALMFFHGQTDPYYYQRPIAIENSLAEYRNFNPVRGEFESQGDAEETIPMDDLEIIIARWQAIGQMRWQMKAGRENLENALKERLNGNPQQETLVAQALAQFDEDTARDVNEYLDKCSLHDIGAEEEIRALLIGVDAEIQAVLHKMAAILGQLPDDGTEKGNAFMLKNLAAAKEVLNAGVTRRITGQTNHGAVFAPGDVPNPLLPGSET